LTEAARARVLNFLSRAMFVAAAVAAVSLVMQYGFYVSEQQQRILSTLDLTIVAVFILDALVRFTLSKRKLTYLRARWPAAALVLLIGAQLYAVWVLKAAGKLPSFLSGTGIFSLAKGYIVVIQFYLVILILSEAIRANRRIASARIAPARTVIFSFLFIIVLGTILLLTPKATVTGTISVIDALFTATSAVCVTGLIVVDTGSYFTTIGHALILILIQIGGLGLITFATFFATALRGGIGVRESLVVRGMMSFESIGRIGRTLKYVIAITFVTEALGAAGLYFSTRFDFHTAGQTLRSAVFHSVSAFCNAGLSLNSMSFERYAGNLPVNLVMTSLIIIGGLGFPVIMVILHKRTPFGRTELGERTWPIHTRIVLGVTAALLVFGTLSFLALEWNGVLAGRPFAEKLLASWFGSVTARTAGFNTVPTVALALPTLFFIAVLMFIGGSPGGTAGGVKTVTFSLMLGSIRSMFSGTGRVEFFRRRIPDWVVREAQAVVAMGIIVVASGVLVLLIIEDLSLSDALFEVVSAFGTVGLSTGVTATLSAPGKLVLIALMLTGRIGPLTLALALAQRRAKPLYDYPEERVFIG
jgi:trk system potassium uptake protein